MPIAYGTNFDELGRNVIQIENLKNMKAAAEAKARNDLMAQLNQARLGQQQIAAQSQAQQNALMMQALQQRQQQGNLDRDFGLRQIAQGNQAQQFRDALEVEKIRATMPGRSLEKAKFEEDARIEEQDIMADAIAKEVNRQLDEEDAKYVQKRIATNKASHTSITTGRANAARDVEKLKNEQDHKLAVETILAPYQRFVGYYNVENTQFKPGWTEGVDNPKTIRLVPVIRGKRGGAKTTNPILNSLPEVETGVGPLPINLPRVQPGRSSTPVPFPATANIVPQVVSQAQTQLPIPSGGMTNPTGALVSAIRQNVLPSIFQAMGRQVYGTGQPPFNPFKDYGNSTINSSYFDPIPVSSY